MPPVQPLSVEIPEDSSLTALATLAIPQIDGPPVQLKPSTGAKAIPVFMTSGTPRDDKLQTFMSQTVLPGPLGPARRHTSTALFPSRPATPEDSALQALVPRPPSSSRLADRAREELGAAPPSADSKASGQAPPQSDLQVFYTVLRQSTKE